MALPVGPIELDIAIEAAFDCLADFGRKADWDPVVCEVRPHPQLNEGAA